MTILESERRCLSIDLGVVSLTQAESLMQQFAKLRADELLPDIVLFLAHPPTVAVGLRGSAQSPPKDLLVPLERLSRENIGFVRSVRGGGITYHWPGQIVVYPVLELPRTERNIPAYMRKLEDVALLTLSQYGLQPSRKRESAAYLGLWLENRKIMSMGIRVTNWVTTFGFAINVCGNIKPTEYVRPCGIQNASITTIEQETGINPNRSELLSHLTRSWEEVFDKSLEWLSPEPEDVFPEMPREPKKQRLGRDQIKSLLNATNHELCGA